MAESDKGPSIEADSFFRRLARVQTAFEGATDGDQELSLASVDGLLLAAGGSDEDNPYKKTTAFQTWLLGYEFPSTLMLISRHKITFLAGASRTKIVEPLKSGAKQRGIEIEVLTRTKDAAANQQLWEKFLQQLSGKTLGNFAKDKFAGKFLDEWEAFLSGQQDGKVRRDSFTTTDVAPAVAAIVAAKEDDEILAQTMGAKATMRMLELFTSEMANVLENEQSVKHEKLSEQMEAKLEVPKTWKGFNPVPGKKFDTALPDWCYTPIIQSGGAYDLRPSAQSDEGKLKAGVVLCSMGVRYKSYCANVGRTYLIDPDKTQKDNFSFLVELQKFVLDQMKDGVNFADVYQATVNKIQTDRPDLAPHFSKSMGFLMGIEFKEPTFSLNHKCQKLLKNNMVFSLNLGFQGIQDPKKSEKTYALQLVDTILVGKNGSSILADGLKSHDDVMFSFDDGAQEKSKTNGAGASAKRAAGRASVAVGTKTRLRQKDRAADEQAEARKQHQKELHDKKNQEGLDRFHAMAGDSLVQEKQWKRFESYAREVQLPDSVKFQQIVVDNRRQSVVVPINGYAVPFHIKTLRSVVKQEEGDYTTLRFMFIAPGQITGKKEDTPFEDPEANFIRALSYRSQDNYRFSELHKQISDLKKESVKREQERQQMADLVDQDRLIEGRRARLHDTWLRPAFEGKRSTGDVEIHQNGIRWSSKARTEHKCDILFSNIKHLFFQPCDNELIVLVHVHLKSPIMIGKKKVKDVQFYREASESSFDETGNRKRRRQHEEDELRMEQEERRQRAALNKEFRQFADKISDASGSRFEVDIPFRELGFGGVPFRSSVTLMPTTDCLVHLSDPPFLVITLEDIEIAHLERVQYGLRNFDLVIVYKDFTRTPSHINTIPSEDLEAVKDWLNSCDIATSEGPVNLNWGAIMKQVNDDPYEFFNEGGWSFLSTDSDNEDGDEDDSEPESDFAPDESDFAGSESESSFSEDLSASDSEGESEPDASDAGSGGDEDDE